MKKVFFVSLVLVLFVSSIASAEVTYSGSSTIGGSFLPEVAELFTKETGIVFDKILIPGSGKGIEDLVAGKVNLAGASRKIKLKEKKLGIRNYVIAYDAVAVVVHKKNPVKDLTKEQLKDIFTGKITNWKEVGGNDAEIIPVTEYLDEGRATQVVFTEIIMNTKVLVGNYAENTKQMDKPADMEKYVSENVNAITAVSFAFVTDKTHAIKVNGVSPEPENIINGAYIISRPLNLVTKRHNVPEDVMKFIEFILTPEAQKIVAKYNFIPVSAE